VSGFLENEPPGIPSRGQLDDGRPKPAG
jgi:hypothetical protein